MLSLRSALVLVLCAVFAPSAAAQPDSQLLDKRQAAGAPRAVTCGTTSYSRAQLEAAITEACTLKKRGKTLSASNNNYYPKKFNNREKLAFAIGKNTYQEFPILSSGLYAGGTPGPDRVVFTFARKCKYAGAITHTGAADGKFIMCSIGQSSQAPPQSSGSQAPPKSGGSQAPPRSGGSRGGRY